jgi:hypothetical protein
LFTQRSSLASFSEQPTRCLLDDHSVRAGQRERIAQAQTEAVLDRSLALKQLTERAMPLLALTHLDLHTR